MDKPVTWKCYVMSLSSICQINGWRAELGLLEKSGQQHEAEDMSCLARPCCWTDAHWKMPIEGNIKAMESQVSQCNGVIPSNGHCT
mmetsp:Transcript_108182/g.187259  ORF Transcript_108182/g.187259 Transcript_108182/m.187259 type:complete len:86 (+) Transcript_108182:91-348(+)